ncbi:unnamed protein product, partial [Mesorhabditis belari]|uniref:RNase NYN domain-containing protein n=1 Tax=Mesorhabditis belari TaxID=2138241 RepID=A0AAF3EQC7_9BILA
MYPRFANARRDEMFTFDQLGFLMPPSDWKKKGLIRRTIVLDAANLLWAAKDATKGDKLDALSLLVIYRYFLVNDFNVRAFVGEKYTLANVVKNVACFAELAGLDVFDELPSTTYDDHALLQYCEEVDGIIVSKDKYESEIDGSSDRIGLIARSQRLIPNFHALPPNVHNTTSTDGHRVTNFKFDFETFKSDKFFASPQDVRYEIIKEQYEIFSDLDRKHIVETIDKMLDNPTSAVAMTRSREVGGEQMVLEALPDDDW